MEENHTIHGSLTGKAKQPTFYALKALMTDIVPRGWSASHYILVSYHYRKILDSSLSKGVILMTTLGRHLTEEQKRSFTQFIDENGNPKDICKTVSEGAATQVLAATSPELKGKG